MTATDKSLAVRSAMDLAQVDELMEVLLGEKTVAKVVEDPEDLQREILMQLRAAETDEELELFGSTVGLRTLARRFVEHDGLAIQPGVPFEIITPGYRWRPSEFQGEGIDIYLIIFARRLDNGEPVTITTGSATTIMQLANRARRGTLIGAKLLATEPEKSTGSKRWPYHLMSIGDNADRYDGVSEAAKVAEA